MSKHTRKIGFFGLDACGKTSFLQTLDQNTSLMTYSLIVRPPKPTTGIERRTFEVLGETVVIWDYGGQDLYRQRYIASKTDLRGLSFAFFMLDIQDPERFDLAAKYFEELLAVSETLEEDETKIAVCLHKTDPDLLGTSTLQDNISKASMLFTDIFPESTPFFLTSIYDEASLRRCFSFGMQKSRLDRERIENGLEYILRKTGGLVAILFDPHPLVIGSATLDNEHYEALEDLGIILTVGWSGTSSNPNMIANAHNGKVLFLRTRMAGHPAFLLTYSPRLPGDSYEGWLAACEDGLERMEIEPE